MKSRASAGGEELKMPELTGAVTVKAMLHPAAANTEMSPHRASQVQTIRSNDKAVERKHGNQSVDIASTVQLSQRHSTFETPGLTPYQMSKQQLSHFQSGQFSTVKETSPNRNSEVKKLVSSSSLGKAASKEHGGQISQTLLAPMGLNPSRSPHEFVVAYQKEHGAATIPQNNLPQIKKNLQLQKQAQNPAKAAKIPLSKRALTKKRQDTNFGSSELPNAVS